MKHHMDISANERTMLWSHSDKDIRNTTISEELGKQPVSIEDKIVIISVYLPSIRELCAK